ncbi:hypothetical protein LJC63_07045 [Ruminococcaceae bacterium OttesenSCG-928-L11]|nr:hypothetical protein [Ruminococcaceae bacterium OttesenSCG-928-L11]
MKKMLYGVVLSSLLLLAGCGAQATAAEPEAKNLPEASETVLGKIKEINGNEILLAFVETGGQAPGMGGAPEGEMLPPGEGDLPGQVQQGERPSGGGGGMGMQMPEGEVPEGRGGQSGGRSDNRRQGMNDTAATGSQSLFTLTGEEQLYQIPVTATVTTGQGDGARTVRFTQLAVKNVVRLHLDETGAILRVEVLA